MTTDVTATAEHMAEAVGEGGGMPQLDITTFPNQIFWLAVTLVVIYLILSRVVLPRIEAILAERQGTITNDLTAAEELKQKAVAAEEAYNKALADARAEANKIVAETKAEIQAELDVAIAKADAEIAAKSAESEKAIAEIRASAQDAIREVAGDTAREIVKSFGAKADAKAIAAAIDARMKG
ncbi:MAG TPA: F0F1 ATP synthase subunit B' [Aliiroseovarius sp.]|nr:F0F1 ATP synthase subunit B' [Aliiroseovarius sp.]